MSTRNSLEDAVLEQLALEAQRYPLHSGYRKQALSKLCSIALQSDRLYRPPIYNARLRGISDEIWETAVQELMLYVCERIDDYKPERASFITWMNFLLSRRFYHQAMRQMQNPKESQVSAAEFLDNLPARESDENYQQSQDVRSLIEADPAGVFQRAHVEGYPEATFQFIAIQKFFKGKSWQELSEQLNLPIPTISSFYRRQLNKFIPLIRELLL